VTAPDEDVGEPPLAASGLAPALLGLDVRAATAAAVRDGVTAGIVEDVPLVVVDGAVAGEEAVAVGVDGDGLASRRA